MSSCLIISGGDFSPFTVPADAYVIACDRGYAYAQSCGVRPDLVVGDFDSYRGEVDAGIPVQKLPVEKDDTDTIGCSRGTGSASSATGTAAPARASSAPSSCARSDRKIRHSGEWGVILGAVIASLSVFAAEDRCRGVSIRGAKYELQDAELTNDFPLGVSNEWAASDAEISLREGTLLIVLSRIR